jgi:hypothetical protein
MLCSASRVSKTNALLNCTAETHAVKGGLHSSNGLKYSNRDVKQRMQPRACVVQFVFNTETMCCACVLHACAV